MCLHQHAEAAVRGPVGMAEARRRHAVGEAGAGIIVLDEGRVEGHGQVLLGLQLGEELLAQLHAQLAQRGRSGLLRLDAYGHVMFELGAVGGVQVGVDERVPRVEVLQQGHHLRGLRLGVVAVEVEVLRGGAPAHLLGAILVGTVVGAEALMAVHVEDGDEDGGDALEDAGLLLPGEQVAQQPEASVLAVNLTGVDAALEEDDGALLARRGGGREGAIRAGDERKQRPAFRRGANRVAADLAGKRLGEGAAERLHFRVAARARPAALFGDGGEGRRCLMQRHGEEGGQEHALPTT